MCERNNKVFRIGAVGKIRSSVMDNIERDPRGLLSLATSAVA